MAPKSQGAVTALEMLEGVLDWGLRLAVLALLLITGYYIYATVAQSDQLFRGLVSAGQQMSAQEYQRHVGNVQLLTRLLLLASVVMVVCGFARFYMAPETGLISLVIGAALLFGMSILIDNMGGPAQNLPRALARVSTIGNPRDYLKAQFGQAGLVFLAAGALQLIVHAILFVVGMKKRRPRANEEAARTASQVRKANDQFLGPCWTLPFCRDTDKKLCPVRHSKKPCWRTGRGCYCDQNIILTLSGGNQYSASRGTAGYLSRSATVARPKSLREKREQCLSCPVYLHHQGQKYKLLAPLALVGVIGAFAFYWGAIGSFFPTLMAQVGRALSNFTFGGRPGDVPTWATELGGNPILSWMIVIVGGLLLIAYLLHAVEWALYRLGI